MTEAEQLAFYRDAYEKHRVLNEALEKSNTHLHEMSALHTESDGMQRAEIRRLREALQEIVRGDVSSNGTFHGTFSGSQCVEIAQAALGTSGKGLIDKEKT